jgi:proteasome lid subunit RPN8/RPN11
MDADIQFGELEEERPRIERRPDEDRHYAVAACGDVRSGDLAVYVDLDTMLDMESHAQSNTSVELGGVLLGGQHVDSEGRPFVVVTDCLRADHYEATKGSFKFTHDTWSDIQRRLEEYPDDLRMVGWYHTHPDWGVFLSGMDLFICENFFNKPLDLALVIDPCRDDRGWFQWTRQARNPARMSAFHLFASRFREQELQYAAQALLGGSGMPLATRSQPNTSGGYGAPVVNVVQDRASMQWTQIAVLSSLALQTVLVAILALSFLRGGGGATSEQLAEIEKEKARQAATRETLSVVARAMGDVDEKFIDRWQKTATENEMNITSLLAAQRVQKDLTSELEHTKKELADTTKQVDDLAKKKLDLAEANDKLKKERNELETMLKEKGLTASGLNYTKPLFWVAMAVALGGGAALVLLIRGGRTPESQAFDHRSQSSGDSDSGFNDVDDRTNS